MDTSLVQNPIIQWGFAGFCLVLLGIIVWLVKRLLKVLEDNNTIILGNTQAIRENVASTQELLRETRNMRDRLLTRPCLREKS